MKDHILSFEPANPIQIDFDTFAASLATCSRGKSPGLSGARYEHYKIALEHKPVLLFLHEVVEILAQTRVPECIRAALGLSNITATTKDNSRIRGISAGHCLRRLVARTISKQKQDRLRAAVAPYNFGLADRSGTDCLIHLIRLLTNSDPSLVV